MKTANMSVVPLRQASLCLDCEMITVAPTSCLACGSDALLNISRALSRPGLEGAGMSDQRAIAGGPGNYPGRERVFFRPGGSAPVRGIQFGFDSTR